MKTTAKTFTHPRRSPKSYDVTPALTRANSTRLWLILRKYSCAGEKPVEIPRTLILLVEVRAWSRNPIDAADSVGFGQNSDQYPSFRIYTRICPPPNSAKLAKGALDLAARFAVILAPSFRPFSRVNWAVKDAGESTAKSLIFGRSVSRAFGDGPFRA